MEAALKKGIITRYLLEKSNPPAEKYFIDQLLISYADLDKLLDIIEHNNDNFFNFATVTKDYFEWVTLTDILNHAVTLKEGSPPSLIHVNEKKACLRLQHHKDLRHIQALPQDDYYYRETSIIAGLEPDLNHCVSESRRKLYALAQQIPGITAFDPQNPEHLESRITTLEKQIRTMENSEPQKAVYQSYLNVFLDLKKIIRLDRISIPQMNGAAKTYCILAESAGGQTEKLSLISLNTVKCRLGYLNSKDKLSLELYTKDRDLFKLSTEAILKLPKHGRVQEVQRESMALNLSRMMGLDTTISLSISHQGRPALFVLFDHIHLLQEFTQGKLFNANFGLSGQTYTNYATLKPVGEGLQADCFFDDFGNSLGLFYLCADADAFGKDRQNKGSRNARSLYIFDLQLMDDDFKLDSRISMQPEGVFKKHSRHFQGRNRTLIEDSSIIAKYDSIIKLQHMVDKIILYVDNIVEQHQIYSKSLKAKLSNNQFIKEHEQLAIQLNLVEQLISDAEQCKNKMLGRIKLIANTLPKSTGNTSITDIRQALILEKLIHNPILYSDDGRPYKNPWTYRQSINLIHIEETADTVHLHFNNKIPQPMLDFIKRRGGIQSLTLLKPTTVVLSKTHLQALNETMLHPELTLRLQLSIDYLATEDIELIKEAYNQGNRANILNVISNYRREINKDIQLPEKIQLMNDTEAKIRSFIRNSQSQDQGFGMHMLKKLHFDVQQQLQKLMNPSYIPVNLSQAFAAALKLDRVSQFNLTVKEALLQNKMTSCNFLEFLNFCIEQATNANDYKSGQLNSQKVKIAAQQVISQLKKDKIPLVKQLGGRQLSEDDILVANPLEVCLRERAVITAVNRSPSQLIIAGEDACEGAQNGY